LPIEEKFSSSHFGQMMAAIEKTGRKKIVLAGLWTETCVALPTVQAIHDNYEVYIVEDGCGDVSHRSEENFGEQIESVLTIVKGRIVYANDPFTTLAPSPLQVSPDSSPVKQYGGYYWSESSRRSLRSSQLLSVVSRISRIAIMGGVSVATISRSRSENHDRSCNWISLGIDHWRGVPVFDIPSPAPPRLI
jgi:hypothetical protein